jgi:hypothetical protein
VELTLGLVAQALLVCWIEGVSGGYVGSECVRSALRVRSLLKPVHSSCAELAEQCGAHSNVHRDMPHGILYAHYAASSKGFPACA